MKLARLPWTREQFVGFLIEFVLPLVVALRILPYIIAWGKFRPWQPATIDLQVYVYAATDLLAGKNILETTTPIWQLHFVNPPIAAILMIPLAFGPYVLWQVLWTGLLIAAQQLVLKRLGVPRGWKLGLVGVALVIAMEPIRTTLGYGQLNTLLMALVIADLLPAAPGERRLIPRGGLIGLAAAVKLTPALFIVFAFLLGKKVLARNGAISFVALTLVGAIFQWSATVQFWKNTLGGETRASSPLYVGNQSLLGVTTRLFDEGRAATVFGLGMSVIVAIVSLVVAVHWWHQGERAFAIGLVGLTTCLASPLAWTHHHVWVLPMAIAMLNKPGWGASLPRWARVVGTTWVLWVCVCPPLAALPYGRGKERHYDLIQMAIGNFGPMLGVILIVGLALNLVSQSRTLAAAEPIAARVPALD